LMQQIVVQKALKVQNVQKALKIPEVRLPK
jgi:hypothetical protein